jgi:large subunit ribosomal protein L28
MFGTDTPAKSGKYQKGLFHGKKHGQRLQRCFSMKYSLITMKPNIMRKTYFSKILRKNLKITVSMKANRCIIKKGGIDKYLLETKPEVIDSKFGLYLR